MDDRIEFRTLTSEKAQFTTAATLLGINLSTFVRMAALEKSNAILKENNTLVLSDRDRDTFLKALENPPQPNENLKKAFLEYQRESR